MSTARHWAPRSPAGFTSWGTVGEVVVLRDAGLSQREVAAPSWACLGTLCEARRIGWQGGWGLKPIQIDRL